MGRILACIVGSLVLSILLLRFLPFIPLEIRIEWITYLGFALMFFTGGAAFAFVKNALIAVVIGVVTFAIVLALLQTIPQILVG